MRTRTQSLALIALAACGAFALALTQCSSPGSTTNAALAAQCAEAWDVIYGVLQHPRCLNCHPVGDAPLQGDDSHPHMQNVRRGPEGKGLYAMRCDTCHSTQNVAGLHMPPGAPNWNLPTPEMPLVFEGRSSSDLCRQLKDPARNGGKSIEEIVEHMSHDALVLWGWNPGDGRAPVSTAHEDLVRALHAWADGGCGCP